MLLQLWMVLTLAGTSAFAQEPVSELTEAQLKMSKALSVRHDAPTCHQLEQLSEAPLADLLVLVDEVKRPSWVGMRAARCVVSRHGSEAEQELVSWVRSPNTLGLARLVASSIDLLPPEVALRVAAAGLDGAHAEDQRKRLQRSELPAVQTLLQQQNP